MTCRVCLAHVSKTFIRPHRRTRLSLATALRTGPRTENWAEIRALADVSVVIEEGERVGLIGANGAGKSTLLHLIAGVAEPTAGKVEVEGRVHAVLTLGTVLREEATGRENIYIDGEIQGRTRTEIDALAGEMIEFSELGEFIDRPVRTYSSGMKARLAFAMIAFLEPEILLVDEALSVGDVHFARKATARMREITARGRIVLLVSHSMQAIVEMCTRCVWLDQGRIRMDGDPRAVTEAYLAEVHDADRNALQRKFAQPDHPPGRNGRRITRVDVVQQGQRTTAVACGRDLDIEVVGEGRDLDRPGVLLRITRVDGTVIAEQESPSELAAPLRGEFALTIGMRPLALGASVYRADVVLTEHGQPVAGGSVVFEARTSDPLIGGVPMLFYPPRVTVSRISDREPTA